jgi:hypothetical protein
VLVVFSAAAIAGLLGEAFAAVVGASTFFRSRVFRLFGIVCHELLSLSEATQLKEVTSTSSRLFRASLTISSSCLAILSSIQSAPH